MEVLLKLSYHFMPFLFNVTLTGLLGQDLDHEGFIYLMWLYF